MTSCDPCLVSAHYDHPLIFVLNSHRQVTWRIRSERLDNTSRHRFWVSAICVYSAVVVMTVTFVCVRSVFFPSRHLVEFHSFASCFVMLCVCAFVRVCVFVCTCECAVCPLCICLCMGVTHTNALHIHLEDRCCHFQNRSWL